MAGIGYGRRLYLAEAAVAVTSVLGISCYFHDSAAAVVIDGVPIAAAQEERFTRIKHDPRFPYRSIEYCLQRAGISGADLDYVAFYERPVEKLWRVSASGLAGLPGSSRSLLGSWRDWARRRFRLEATVTSILGVKASSVVYVDHHVSHAASAFYASPFKDAAILTIDGVGEWNTATVGSAVRNSAEGSRLNLELALDFPHSLGLLYSTFTSFLGFSVNDGEFKVMGLAAYGRPIFRDKIEQVCRINADGSVTLDMRYFEYHVDSRRMHSSLFLGLFGTPRSSSMPFETDEGLSKENQYYADLAASIQAFCEDAVVAMACEAYRRNPSPNVAYAGGVALNGLANAAILERTPFQNLYIPSAPGDDGAALGSALYVEAISSGRSNVHALTRANLGKEYSADIVVEALRDWGLSFVQMEPEVIVDRTADILARGRTIGWLHGGFEWGPRALGNRSILASPLEESMGDAVNLKIKFRERFRPFAPAIAGDYVQNYFSGPLGQAPSRFMQMVLRYADDPAHALPATNHFGTGRVQSVYSDDSPRFHDLLLAFGRRTGHPALLNTSMNLRGEPIAASPADALSVFMRSNLDALVLENCLVEKAR